MFQHRRQNMTSKFAPIWWIEKLFITKGEVSEGVPKRSNIDWETKLRQSKISNSIGVDCRIIRRARQKWRKEILTHEMGIYKFKQRTGSLCNFRCTQVLLFSHALSLQERFEATMPLILLLIFQCLIVAKCGKACISTPCEKLLKAFNINNILG